MRHLGRRGFTLIELLVVIGIIVLLATFLLPMLQRAQIQARRTSMAADLQVISQALEAYKGDFGDYPRVNRLQAQGWINGQPVLPANPVTLNPSFAVGAQILCWALIAPGGAGQDGADGPGFRIRGTVGSVKGPYLPPDRFLIGTADGVGVVHQPGALMGAQAKFDDSQDVLADRNNSPILYFPAGRGADPTKSFVMATYVPNFLNGPASLPSVVFIFDDNHAFLDTTHQVTNRLGQNVADVSQGNPLDLTRGANEVGWRVMAYRLGDTNYNGAIDPGEVPVTTGPYLLWTAGPDTIFGNDDDVMCDGTQLQQVTGPLPLAIMPR
ncbi:MAG TPA: prepilin-type N-terminal cleavage/methylation domain-containing protein [Tepidisphaeraceae bacterium]|jgi:prepilin-type N-terminal cleavage/methylation domain-containing protein|nr:prepilin-type N-terminal cleavage/methylation domain-containing protein [Tepidisphaeraceae bacterium]